MSPRVRTRHGEFTTEQVWSGSGSWSGITPAIGRTVHYQPPPPQLFKIVCEADEPDTNIGILVVMLPQDAGESLKQSL
ncbi:hypothetical protein Hanom_Chr00s006581g01734711 [Helianthus anomalus]